MTEPARPEPLSPPDFLRGGLLFRLLLRFHVDIVEARHAAVRAATVGILLWAPMAVLCLLDGTLLPGKVRMPFLFDVAAYVRPLVTVPLLIAAEPVLGGAWLTALARFESRGLVPPERVSAFRSEIARAVGGRDRRLPEVVCGVLAAAVSALILGAALEADADAWFFRRVDGAARLSWAGAWYLVLVLGGGIFLILRWAWRIVVWHRLLARVARLPLRLSPVHPDRACGLEFVSRPIEACAILTLALTAALAGRFANQVVHQDVSVLGFVAPAGVFAGIVLALLLLPTAAVFAPVLVRTRRDALVAISALAARCGDGFLASPAEPTSAAPEPGGPALQDVFTAVDAIRAILPVPFRLTTVVVLVVSMSVPALGLALLEIPAADLAARLARLVF